MGLTLSTSIVNKLDKNMRISTLSSITKVPIGNMVLPRGRSMDMWYREGIDDEVSLGKDIWIHNVDKSYITGLEVYSYALYENSEIDVVASAADDPVGFCLVPKKGSMLWRVNLFRAIARACGNGCCAQRTKQGRVPLQFLLPMLHEGSVSSEASAQDGRAQDPVLGTLPNTDVSGEGGVSSENTPRTPDSVLGMLANADVSGDRQAPTLPNKRSMIELISATRGRGQPS